MRLVAQKGRKQAFTFEPQPRIHTKRADSTQNRPHLAWPIEKSRLDSPSQTSQPAPEIGWQKKKGSSTFRRPIDQRGD